MCVVSAVPMPAPNLGIRMRGMRACQAAAEPSMALCRGLTPISKAWQACRLTMTVHWRRTSTLSIAPRP